MSICVRLITGSLTCPSTFCGRWRGWSGWLGSRNFFCFTIKLAALPIWNTSQPWRCWSWAPIASGYGTKDLSLRTLWKHITGHYRKNYKMIKSCFCVFLSSQVIENLDTLSSLQSLFLGTNKITKLQNLEGLHNLTVLSIQVISYVIFKTCLSGFKNAENSACALKHSLIILLNVICRVTGSLKSRVCRTSSTSKSSTWATMASRSLRAWKTMWVIEAQCISESTACQIVHAVWIYAQQN